MRGDVGGGRAAAFEASVHQPVEIVCDASEPLSLLRSPRTELSPLHKTQGDSFQIVFHILNQKLSTS